MTDFSHRRGVMVSQYVAGRGVRDPLVLEAMNSVPRELFVPADLQNLAYEDAPLPIAAGQTISQPYIVAYMVEALNLEAGDRVLEIGAGSGYAAAVLARIAGKVYTIERVQELAQMAKENLHRAGIDNVSVKLADGTLGWADKAPFDAILVSAGAPDVPRELQAQLKIGGRLVVPVGASTRAQELVRITRLDEENFRREDLADVRFVPLIGANGWEVEESGVPQTAPRTVRKTATGDAALAGAIVRAGEGFTHLQSADLTPLLERIGDARVVLLGEASHGTSEFYQMRARISEALIHEKDFTVIAVEGDWPDMMHVNHYIHHRQAPSSEWETFARFPTWMWRNREVKNFVDTLHRHNAQTDKKNQVSVYGLDLYSLFTSIQAVLGYLDDKDPELAAIARQRYGCLSPWEADPAAYGHAALRGAYKSCEDDVTHMLTAMLKARIHDTNGMDGEAMDAVQNARIIANAEQYYRIMYYGSRASWNLRDQHMFDTLQALRQFHGADTKVIVWAHNSHVGNAQATEMSARGEFNIGQLCTESFGHDVYKIGFGTDHGTVAAASDWDGPMQIKQVRPAHRQSYEHQFHLTNTPGLLLPLRGAPDEVRQALLAPRLERAIGVIYRPETELASHYFEAILPRQFDEYIWLDETRAVTPLPTGQIPGLAETYPFGV